MFFIFTTFLKITIQYSSSEAYPEPGETSMMECFAEIVNICTPRQLPKEANFSICEIFISFAQTNLIIVSAGAA